MDKYKNAIAIMTKFKGELEVMRKEAKPDDTMPAGVFFMFMDVLIPAFDGIVEEITRVKEGEQDVSE